MSEQKTNWKAGLAFGKVAPLPPSDWKAKAGLVKIQETKKKPENAKEKKPLERKTPIAKIGKKKKERIKNEGSEVDLFRRIWEVSPHKCEICSKSISEARPECFAHRLSKGRYPEHRMNPKNIALVCSIDCHHKLDAMNKGRDAEIISFL